LRPPVPRNEGVVDLKLQSGIEDQPIFVVKSVGDRVEELLLG